MRYPQREESGADLGVPNTIGGRGGSLLKCDNPFGKVPPRFLDAAL